MNSNEIFADFPEQQPNSTNLSSPVSTTSSTSIYVPDLLDNIHNYSITTEINDSGEIELLVINKYCRNKIILNRGML